MDINPSDLATIGILVVLEGLLSADNALVVAVMILGLPRDDQSKALKYGLFGAFVFRTIATLLAVYLIKIAWVKLAGGLYLVYLTYQHFFRSGTAEERSKPRPARPWMGLPALWATILKVELVNIAFSVDSILVAVAMSRKTWVVLTGGLIGIVAMRVVISQLLVIVRRYPTIVDGAFVIIALVGAKLLVEDAAAMHWIEVEIPRWLSLTVIAVTFVIAYLRARRKGPVDDDGTDGDSAAAALLGEDKSRAPKRTSDGR
jgi:YkoY family integral membrane protein